MKTHSPVVMSAARLFLYFALAFALGVACPGAASAQSSDTRIGPMVCTYFDNNGAAGAPDAFIHILNPGVDPGVVAGTLCASIYVWRNDQELSECCSCPIPPNGLLMFTVRAATANPGDHAGNPVSGSIIIIADSGCDPTHPFAPNDQTNGVGALRAWATHVNFDTAISGFDVTETEALDTPLSSGEQFEAATRCGFIRVNSSGAGRCDAVCTFSGT